jgi:hypothetical protein
MSHYTQVHLLFWANNPGNPDSDPVPLAYVHFYTTENTGRLDNTKLTKLCWEFEQRPAADIFPGRQPKFDVVEVDSLIKLEHVVPMWQTDTMTKDMFYVNKYASFCYMTLYNIM